MRVRWLGAVADPYVTKSLKDIVPTVRHYFDQLIAQAKAMGMEPEIRSAGRTCEEQAEQKKLGYSQADYCRSMHVFGHAVDLNLKPATCATYTKLGEWWESIGGVWGGRWKQFGPCGDMGHFHYGFDGAQAVPTSACPSEVTLAQCRDLREKYYKDQDLDLSGVGPYVFWKLVGWTAVLGLGWWLFRGTLAVKPGSRALKGNPEKKLYEYGLLLRPVAHWTVPPGYVSFRNDPNYKHGVVQYEKPLSGKDIKKFDLEPLDPKDPINLWKALQKRKEECRALIYEQFATDSIYVVELPDGSRESLTYSTRENVDYQLTHWLPDGTPSGHVDYNDFDEAVLAICYYLKKGKHVPRSSFLENPSQVFYHGTSSVFWPEIKKYGLRTEDDVYLTATREEALGWAQMRVANLKWRGLPSGKALVLKVRPSSPPKEMMGVFVHAGSIPPQQVQR